MDLQVLCDCMGIKATELGQLSSASGAGLGLFLALAIVQVVGSGGVSQLRRKSDQLRQVVRANRLGTERESVARIEANLLRLELSLERLSKWLVFVSFALILIAAGGQALVTLYPKASISCLFSLTIVAYYLVLPFLIFIFASVIVRMKCGAVRKQISAAEERILTGL